MGKVQQTRQLTLEGFATNYHCKKCPFTAIEMSEICRHAKIAHAKQYKKCRTKGCSTMILNSKLHRFCTPCLIEFEKQNKPIYAVQEELPIKCKVCGELQSEHTQEMAYECIDSFADDLISNCQQTVKDQRK